MTDTYREGARCFDPEDKCPKCIDGGRVVFGSDFHKMGEHKIRACAACATVYDHDHPQGPLTVHPQGA